MAAQRQHAEGAGHRSAAGTCRPVAEIHRRRYSRPGRVSGDVEVTVDSAPPWRIEKRSSEAKMNRILGSLSLCAAALPIALLAAQAPDASRLDKYPEAWPTHYGDFSGRRYSPLTQ